MRPLIARNLSAARRASLAFAMMSVGLATVGASGVSLAQCGDNSPATPVPEFRDGVRLWPDGFRPGSPGQTLPLIRDSTQRVGGVGTPSAATGFELFKAVDAIDDRLFVAYGLGIQAWTIEGAFAENPGLLAFRDGLGGGFLAFPGQQEVLNFIEDLDAVEHGDDVLIGVAGRQEVGTTIWSFDHNFTQHYQDLGTISEQVRMIEQGGRHYLLAATDGGVAVYDATAASLGAPCLDDRGATCPGVYRGLFPNDVLGAYVDAIVWNGRTFVSSSDGRSFVKPLILWELPDAAQPASARQIVVGDVDARGAAFLPLGDRLFFAYASKNPSRVQIFDIDHCVDGDGCTDLGPVVAELDVGDGDLQFLTFSRSGELPFLYYGVATNNALGDRIEGLWQLDALPGNGAPREITAGGETYVDPCNGLVVDYWGDYYEANDAGLRNMHPRKGAFAGRYFYRAAQSILDVHVLTEAVPSPLIFRDGFEDATIGAWRGESAGAGGAVAP
ncbi:MAG: hypothetical protein AAGN46_00750 [Acidobacteriota bacterium]